MICVLVTIGNIWINPCNVHYMKPRDAGCTINVTGLKHYPHIDMKCEAVAHIINTTVMQYAIDIEKRGREAYEVK